MMTTNNIIPVGGGYDRDEKVVLHTYKIVKQFIVSNINYCIEAMNLYMYCRKKVLHYE